MSRMELKAKELAARAAALPQDKKSLETKFQNLSTQLEKDRRAARKVARNKDTINSLLQALTNQPKFTKMVEYAVTCIKGLSVDVPSAIELVDEGVVEALKNVLNLNPYNERIQELVNGALQALCLTDDLATLVADKLGGGKEMVRSMNKHTSPETLISTCKATTKLMRSSANVGVFVKDGVIPALGNVVKGAKGNPDVIAAAAQTLNRVADDAKNASQIFEHGGIKEIIEALRLNPKNRDLVRDAMGVLTKLGKADPAILKALKEMGAVDVIAAALDEWPDDKELLSLGAAALGTLADKHDVNSALKALSAGDASTSAKVAHALAKIASLMLVAENVDHMIKNEGVGWLIAALSSAVGDKSETAAKILFSGCQALMRCCSDENRIYNVMQKGGVKLLVSIIKAHVEDEKVACAALAALAKMLTRKENAIFIIKSGGIEAALSILNAHPDSAKAALGVLDFFQRIAAHDECIPALVNAGVIEAVSAIMKKHGDNPEILESCLALLSRLANTPENMQRINAAGGLESLVSILNDKKENLAICKQALNLMDAISMHPANIEALRKLGAVAAILNAISAHPDDSDFQALGSKLLARIAGGGQLKDAIDNVASLARIGGAANLSKMMAAVNILKNLAMVDSNIAELIKQGAHNALFSAFEAAVKLPPSEKRDELMLAAAEGLLRLARDTQCGQSLVKSGAFSKMLKAALTTKSEAVAERVMDMAALLSSNSANIAKMVADGAIEDICALAKAHPLNEKILASATRALGNLAINAENIARIIKAGGAEIVVESIFANMENREALVNALEVLQKLAINEEAIEALLKAGALDALIETIRTYPNDTEILCHCFSALCQLLISAEVAEQIGEKGALPLCVKAMRQHYQNPEVCEIDMILMDSCATIPANAKRLLEKELATIELVKYIAGVWSDSTQLVEAAARLLAALEDPDGSRRKAAMELAEMKDLMNLADEVKCEQLLSKLKSTKMNSNEQLAMLKSLAKSLQNPENARAFLNKGGLKALAAVMKNSKDNEQIFYTAANAFLNLTDIGGEQVELMLQEPECLEALGTMLNAHELFPTPMDLDDLTRAVGCMAKMKLAPASVNELLKNKNALTSLLKIIAQSDDPMLLAQAARLLGKLSNNPEASKLLHKIVNIRELIVAMRRNIQNKDFLKYSVFLLGNLAQNEELAGVIGVEGGVQIILQIMELFPEEEALIENCCYALANLTFGNDVNCNFVVACKGIPTLIKSIVRHNKAEELLESAVCVLNNLGRGNETNKDAIVKADGAQAIIDTVLANFNAMELLLTCFRTLGNLAYNTNTISAVIAAGGVQGIVAGMTVHAEEADVIDVAIKVLTNLSAEEEDENQEILCQEGAVQAVVEVLNQFSDNADLVSSALNCLCNLSVFDESAKIVILQGGVKSMVKVLEEVEYDADACENAMRLLTMLADIKAEVDRILDAGITSCLITTIHKNKAEPSVVGLALASAAGLACNENTALRMGEEKMVEAVLGVINEFKEDVDIQVDAFGALSGLSRSQQNAAGMAERAMKQLSAGYAEYAQSHKWLTAAWSFLGNLCVSQEASEHAADTDVVAQTLAALKKNLSGDPALLIRGLRALENMAYGSDRVKDHMKREGTENAIKGIDAASTHGDVKRACKGVLDALAKAGKYQAGEFTQLKPRDVPQKTTVRSIFGDDIKKVELKQETKNFLTAGQLILKHSNNAAPRSRHVYVTTDLKYLIWKDPKKATLDEKNKMKIFKIRTVEKGRCTPQLQRKNLLGKHLAKEECAFSIMGRERTVDLEAKNEADRDKWVAAVEALMAWRKAVKAQNTKFDSR